MKTKKSNSKKVVAKVKTPIKKAKTKVAATPKKVTPVVKKKLSSPSKSTTPKKIATSGKKVAPTSISVKNPVKTKKEQVFRYSDKDLNMFRELIDERLDVAKRELHFMQGQLSSDPRLNLEDGSGAMDREQLSTLTSRQILYISNLEKALIRIINKTYGVCRETGKLIDKARLRITLTLWGVPKLAKYFFKPKQEEICFCNPSKISPEEFDFSIERFRMSVC